MVDFNLTEQQEMLVELAREFADDELIPNAEITFDENGKPTPFIDDQNDQRIREELSFVPKSLKEGIRAHMNEARIANDLNPI